MSKIVLVGAASASFAPSTIAGLLTEREALAGSTVTLVDLNQPGLETMAALTRRAADEYGAKLHVEATTDLAQGLDGADFVIVSVAVDINDTQRLDWKIPLKHGFRNVMAENGGPGGLAHSLRSINLMLDVCAEIERIAPEAMVLNYTNPMSRVCLALTRYTSLNVIGLCHQIGWAFRNVGILMDWVSRERRDEYKAQVRSVEDRVDIEAYGLNHFTFITKLRDRETGADLYPELRRRLADFDPSFEPETKLVHDVFGLYPVPGDGHLGEYLAWASREVGPPIDRWEQLAAQLFEDAAAASDGRLPLGEVLEVDRATHDRAPAIVAAIVAGRPQHELAVNVVNGGCIPGLPEWAVVEVPGVAGPHGVHGLAMDPLPAGITAMLNQQIAVQDRVVEAAVHGDRNAALQALLLDPITAARPDAAKAMLDEMLEVHARYLPRFNGRATEHQALESAAAVG
jgi:alpha-galactosidase/6-phospho-beta-glucosidase family protein